MAGGSIGVVFFQLGSLIGGGEFISQQRLNTYNIMIIRPLTIVDIPLYRELRLKALTRHPEAFGETVEHFKNSTVEQLSERLIALNKCGGFILGAFEDENSLVGLVALSREESEKMLHRGKLWGMYVDPVVRAKGVGRMLVSQLLELAKQSSGLEQIHLSVVLTNEAAIKLYRSTGFEVYGTDPHALKVGECFHDEYLMVRFLRASGGVVKYSEKA